MWPTRRERSQSPAHCHQCQCAGAGGAKSKLVVGHWCGPCALCCFSCVLLALNRRCGFLHDTFFCWFSLSIERSWRVRSAELRFAPLVIPPLEIARGRAARVVFRRETKPSRRKTFDSAQPPDPSLLNAPTVPAPWITPNFLLQPLAKLLPSLGDSVFQGCAEKPPLSPSNRRCVEHHVRVETAPD